ncbi:glycoside hydrolase family 99-like domain-containing protein (plasmid) [Chromobacterium amazonense]|uniref:glycoside hydrolase family 99-like domain-containing protein n=1 Tax=Chromobacterium amazonense TaxID=1382803 RepID=UPI00237E8277|nr:glycoside hydrolase family 99-like domain-containing protein [Chromobacterium amazonense]MDE1713182.1 glycoside hydrolase family 99-like domain-containing protein [Chromobacterium amazonense]
MKPFAIYFPQFYPTATNNKAWGKGFTDWSLVANANLRNQWVRRAPLRGFYDGASPEVHQAQINEMKNGGLGGFAVYHYWFYTHQELNAFESTILERSPGLPWFMIWASEGWSKRWLGDSTSILRLTDAPTDADIGNHCDYLMKCFESPDYLRIDGCPLFIFYNLSHFSNPEAVLNGYRTAMRQRGSEIYFGHFVKNPFDVQYSRLVDVTYLFEPRLFFGMQRAGRSNTAKYVFDVLRSFLSEAAISRFMLLMDRVQQRGVTYDSQLFMLYLQSAQRASFIQNIQGLVQDVLSPGWNNTPRYSERFTAMGNIDAQVFAQLLLKSSDRCKVLPPLVNAWNEWSEGAAIEPCAYFESSYLDAIKATFTSALNPASRSGDLLPRNCSGER